MLTDEQYYTGELYAWLTGDRDCSLVRRQKIVIVERTKKPYPCWISREQHEIPAGSRAVCETAIVDGKWRRCYACLECLERSYREMHGLAAPPVEEKENV